MKQLYKKTVGMPKVTVDMPKRNIITDWTKHGQQNLYSAALLSKQNGTRVKDSLHTKPDPWTWQE